MKAVRIGMVVLSVAFGFCLFASPALAVPIDCSCSYCENHLSNYCNDSGTTVRCSSYFRQCNTPAPMSTENAGNPQGGELAWLTLETASSCQTSAPH